jgi:arylsulfatase A-like enzyme
MSAAFLAVGLSASPVLRAAEAESAGPSPDPAASSRPNILFFEVDDLMYRFMGKLGRHFTITPNIDRLADQGIYFSSAVCQGMMCGPSRNSLIVGVYPHNIGFYRNGQMGDLPRGIWSLPAAMHRAGYATAWVGKCHVHPPRTSRKQKISEALKGMGFDYAVASVGRAVLASRVRKGANMTGDVYIEHLRKYGLLEQYIDDCKTNRPVTSLPEEHYLDGFYTHTALEWLENYDGKMPFFLWLNLSCPHGPHDVPQKYHDLYNGKKIPGPLTESFGGEIPAGLLKDNRPVRPRQVGEHRRGFAAATTFVDAMLFKVVEKLKAMGEYDDTVIVFFSDHGIFMGNHGRFHKGSVFNEICNPSLIVHYPKKFRKGDIEKHPVELLDLVKTALDIAGAPESEKKIPFGESLMPLIDGKGAYKTKYVFSEIEGFQSCYDGRYRYIANDVEPLLYDLKTDSGEMKNIAGKKPEIAARMKKATEKWFAKTGKPLPAGALRDPERLKNWKR